MTLHNIAGMGTVTEGDSDLTLSTTLGGFISFESAGVIDEEKIRYTLRNGLQTEVGLATYDATGPLLKSRVPEYSTDSDNSAISCVGLSRVYLTALASDFPSGWMPYAYPDGYEISGTIAALALTANGGSIAIPIRLIAPMSLKSVSVWNTDSDTARTWGWDIYRDNVNDELSASNSLTRYAASDSDETFTPTVASTRTIAVATAVRLSPGLYWLVIQNTHATSTFGLGNVATNGFSTNTAQTKTTTNPNGATLDFVAATWTKKNDVYCVRLNGEVFGQTTIF